MLARAERGTNEELLTVVPDRIHAHGERLWRASVSRTRVSGFHQVRRFKKSTKLNKERKNGTAAGGPQPCPNAAEGRCTGASSSCRCDCTPAASDPLVSAVVFSQSHPHHTRHRCQLCASQEVSTTLLHIGVPHLVEYVTPDGLFSVDIALRNGAQVCGAAS